MEVKDLSILSWIINNQVKTEKGEVLNFRDRLFLLDILADWNKDIVVKACAQVGKSVAFTLKTLYAVKTFGVNIVYTFPSDSDVNEFVSSKTNKIIGANRHIFPNLATDNIERKELNGRFIYFKGTISKTAPISTTADVLVHDEADRSDQSALNTYKSRTKASDYGARWIFSNPTTERGVVDLAWLESDKREWFITCEHCKVKHQLRYPESIDKDKRCFICTECKTPISDDTRRKGDWVATDPDKKVSGYHISHLMACWISAEQILQDSEGDQEYFHNFVLGEPYTPGNLQVSRQILLDAWTPRDITTDQWYLGVDVGNLKHYCLGSDKGIIKIGIFSDWSELDDIIKMYQPVTVIDAMPENTISKHFVKSYPRTYMCYLNRDKKQKRLWHMGSKEEYGVIHADRNRMLDQMISDIMEAQFLLGIKADKDLRKYIEHWETLRRVKEVDALGVERYVWSSTNGNEHFVFSSLFYRLAVTLGGEGQQFDVDEKPNVIKQVKGGEIIDLEEFFDNYQ